MLNVAQSTGGFEPENDATLCSGGCWVAQMGNGCRVSEIFGQGCLFCAARPRSVRDMKTYLGSVVSTAFLTGALYAAEPMSGAEFEAYVTGSTIYFAQNGQPYGGEEYHDNRRVRWSFLDGHCAEGVWYEDRDMICFVYDHTPDPQCWAFYQEPGGLRGVFENDPNATILVETSQASGPLLCLGPDVGV